MEGIKALLKNERGVVLVISLMILTLLVGAGVGAIVSTQTDLKTSGNLKTATQAFYIAEAGLQRAIRNLNKITNWIGGLANTSDAFSGDNSLGNGTYVVQVFENDPSSPNVRIRSTGIIANSSSTVEAVVAPEFFPILDYAAYSCGNLTLKLKEGGGSVSSLISGGDVFVSGNLDLEGSGTHQIQNGNVSVLGDININGTSSITGGNASANGNMNLQSSASPNVGGNATAGGNISGGGTVTGTTNATASPLPVTNLCLGSELAVRAITSDVIQGFRSSAGTTISGNFTAGSTITQTGIVHVTGDFELTGNATFSGNVIFIVDGNAEITGPGSLTSSPAGSTVTFLVPTGNFDVLGGGNFTIDGILHVGTVNPNGSGISGGNITVQTGSNLTVNGSVVAANGNTDNQGTSAFTVNYQPPTDSNLIKPNSFTITRWNDVVG